MVNYHKILTKSYAKLRFIEGSLEFAILKVMDERSKEKDFFNGKKAIVTKMRHKL